jgi:hypothetical protein
MSDAFQSISTTSTSKNFDSFNGTEIKLFVKVPTSMDQYGSVLKFEIVELGSASQISAAKQYSVTPITAIGASRAIAVATGSSMVAGSLVFEVFNKGFVGEIKRILKAAGISKLSYSMPDGSSTYATGYSEIENINEFPLMDIILIGVKENNANKKIQKEILGLRFTKGGSAIGVNQLGVREAFQFMAIDMTDFRPVIGAEVTEDDDSSSTETYMFA